MLVSLKSSARLRAGLLATALTALVPAALTPAAYAQGLGAPTPPAPVPEPSAWAAFVIGGVVLLLMGCIAVKRRSAA